MGSRRDWLEEARCRLPGVDPRIFFPDSSSVSAMWEALEVCARCTVLDECREWTLDDDAKVGPRRIYGVCGGMVPEHRRALAAKRAKDEFAVSELRFCAGGCGRRLYPRRAESLGIPGVVSEQAHGMCGACDRRVREEARK